MVPVAHGGSAAAYRADVENPQASPLTSEVFAYSKPGDRDVFVWMQNAEPNVYQVNGTDAEPALAESCEPNEDSTVWVCTLRQGVKFHDGSDFDSSDVVATFDMGLNPFSPNHKGNTNLWEYYDYLWGLMWK